MIRIWKKQKRDMSKEDHSVKNSNSCSMFLAMLLQLLMIMASIAFLHQNMVSTTSSDSGNQTYLSHMKPTVSTLIPWTASIQWKSNSNWIPETQSMGEEKERKQRDGAATMKRIEDKAQWDDVETVKRTKDRESLRTAPKVIML
jgi:hypothetical protein